MLALIILRGTAYTGILFLGVVLAELLVLRIELPSHIIIAVGLIVAAVYGYVAHLVRKHLRLDEDVFHPRDIVVLFAFGATGAVAVSALLSMVLLSIKFYDLNDIARTAAPLVLGDLIGIVVVTPLVIRAYTKKDELRLLSRKTIAEFAILTVAVLGVLVFTTWPGNNHQHLFYLLFLPVVIAAVRHGIDGSCAALAIVQLVLVALLHYQGLELSLFTQYQFRMLVLTLTGLVVGSLVSERQRSDERARKAAENVQELRADAARVARVNLVSGMAAALSHEINQPLTAARALARAVQQLLTGPEKDLQRAEKNVAAMIEQIDHAGAIVWRMREFLRRGEPHISTLDVRVVLEEAILLVQPLTKARRVQVALDVAGDMPPVFGDRVQIQQVVMNLVRNGIEAIEESGRPDGSIIVSAKQIETRNEIEISAQDNGTGIDSEAVNSLFEPLNTSRPGGIGLGLSICKTIVQAHGGRIWLASSQPGRTVFCFTLPTGHAKAASE